MQKLVIINRYFAFLFFRRRNTSKISAILEFSNHISTFTFWKQFGTAIIVSG